MNLNLVILVGKEFQRRGPVNFRERKPYWVVLDRSDLTSSNKLLRLKCLFIRKCFFFCRYLQGNLLKALPLEVFKGLPSLKYL